jgi:hypothetical protein
MERSLAMFMGDRMYFVTTPDIPDHVTREFLNVPMVPPEDRRRIQEFLTIRCVNLRDNAQCDTLFNDAKAQYTDIGTHECLCEENPTVIRSDSPRVECQGKLCPLGHIFHEECVRNLVEPGSTDAWLCPGCILLRELLFHVISKNNFAMLSSYEPKEWGVKVDELCREHSRALKASFRLDPESLRRAHRFAMGRGDS